MTNEYTYYTVRVSNKNNRIEILDTQSNSWKPLYSQLQIAANEAQASANDIPPEVFNHIFSYLNSVDLSRSVPLVCSQWAYYASNNELWKQLYKQQYGELSSTIKRRVELATIGDEDHFYKTVYSYRKELDQRWLSKNEYVHSALSHSEFAKQNDDTGFGSFYGYSCVRMNRFEDDVTKVSVFSAVNKSIYRSTIDLKEKEVHLLDNSVLTGSDGLVWTMDHSPHRLGCNKLVSGGYSGSMLIWDLETSQPIHTMAGLHSAGIWSIKIIDSNTAVSCGTDGVVQLFDINTGSTVPLQKYAEHQSAAYDVDCITQGASTNIFVSGSADKSVRVYDRRVVGSSVMSQTNLGVIMEIEASQMERSNVIIAGTDEGAVVMLDMRKMGQDTDSAIVMNWPLFNFTGIRGLSYDGSRLVVGSKKGTVVATSDPCVSIDQTREDYISSLKLGWVNNTVIDGSFESPFRVVQVLPQGNVISMQSDEELLLCGTTSNILNFYDFSGNVTKPLGKKYKPHKCLIQ
jgi:WD40 repeat protein